jgi:hypothetical protein
VVAVTPVDLTAAADPEMSHVVILREPTFLVPFLSALSASSDPAIPSETIIVVAPTSGLADEVRSMARGVRVVECPIDLGTAAAWNLAVEAAKAPVIALLHEDTLVARGWERTRELLSDTIGVVGPRLLNSDRSLQCTGWIVFRDGRCAPVDDRVALTTNDVWRTNDCLDVDLVSSACMFFATDTWRRVGGFDERYFPAVGVDVDFCLAVRSSGLRVVCSDLVDVVHASGAMMRPDRVDGDQAVRTFLIWQNHSILGRQWVPVLERRPPFPASDDELREAAARYWDESLFDVHGAADGPRVPDRSITGGERLIDDGIPDGVSFRAANRRTEVLEDCIAWMARDLDQQGDDGGKAAAEQVWADSERDRARLAAIECSRTWRARNAVVRLLPDRWRVGRG